MSSDELPRFLDEELHRVDAFELEEPQSLHDLLLLNTSPIPCVVTKREEHRFHVLPLLDLALQHWLLRGDGRRCEGTLHAVQLAQADM